MSKGEKSMNILMTIDVGNTNISLGLMQGNEVIGSFRLTTKTPRTSDEFGLCINPREIFVFPTSIVIRIFMLFSPLDMF